MGKARQRWAFLGERGRSSSVGRSVLSSEDPNGDFRIPPGIFYDEDDLLEDPEYSGVFDCDEEEGVIEAPGGPESFTGNIVARLRRLKER
jgi:hypothetical protein